MMTPLENLHYAIGELAYAVAAIDGKVNQKERKKFHDIVAAEMHCKDYNFDVSEIIFQILDKDKEDDAETIYKSAINTIKTNGHYLSPELKATFILVMEKVAKAFPPVTDTERKLIERFRKDITPIVGDPIYYQSK